MFGFIHLFELRQPAVANTMRILYPNLATAARLQVNNSQILHMSLSRGGINSSRGGQSISLVFQPRVYR